MSTGMLHALSIAIHRAGSALRYLASRECDRCGLAILVILPVLAVTVGLVPYRSGCHQEESKTAVTETLFEAGGVRCSVKSDPGCVDACEACPEDRDEAPAVALRPSPPRPTGVVPVSPGIPPAAPPPRTSDRARPPPIPHPPDAHFLVRRLLI